MHIRKKTGIAALLVGLLFCSAAFAEEFKAFLGEINSDGVNLRSDSTVSSESIYKLQKGELIDVIAESYGWFKIRLPKTAPSFIKKNLVILLNDRTLRVAKNSVNIRVAPNESSPIVGKVYSDEVLTILGDRGSWYRIEPVDNSFGWIHKKFVKIAALEKKPEPTLASSAIEQKPFIQNPIIKDTSITVEGIVKPYGFLFFRPTTHKLVCQQDKTFLLKGNRKTLNAVAYHNVRLVGKLNDSASYKYPIIAIEKIEALD